MVDDPRGCPARIVEVVGGHRHLYISFAWLLGVAATRVVSIRVLLVVVVVLLPVVYVGLLLVLNRGALVVRGHVLTCIARISQLYTPVVICLQTRLLVESIFEAHPIVGHVSLFAAISQGSSYTL